MRLSMLATQYASIREGYSSYADTLQVQLGKKKAATQSLQPTALPSSPNSSALSDQYQTYPHKSALHASPITLHFRHFPAIHQPETDQKCI